MKNINIFVYGTLLKGQRAHYMLEGCEYLGNYRLSDYGMYNLGSYPGVKYCKGESVEGEVYSVPESLLPSLDRYEGSMYHRVKLEVSNVEGSYNVCLYEYKGNSEGKLMREKWGSKPDEYVWYATYGSNLSADRFTVYIKGGVCKDNGKCYLGCTDHSLWIGEKVSMYPGKMYFGSNSSSWGNCGVSFYDWMSAGECVMRQYKITREQFHEIREQEGSGSSWYGKVHLLGIETDGCPIYTLTSEISNQYNAPADNYVALIRRSLINECGLTERAADRYIQSCMNPDLKYNNNEVFLHMGPKGGTDKMDLGNNGRIRTKHETMCAENLGSINNNGPAIPVGVQVRQLQSVMSTNASVTAKTDEEIYELSKLNENVIVSGDPKKDSLYRVRFTGSFDLSNFCYAIIKPNCRCVVSQEGNKMYVTTAKFRTMNALSGLISRLAENIVMRVEVFRYDPDGTIHLINDTNAYNEIISFIQEDYRRQRTGRIVKSLIYETKGATDDEAEKVIAALRQEISEKDEEIRKLKEENGRMRKFVDCVEAAIREI